MAHAMVTDFIQAFSTEELQMLALLDVADLSTAIDPSDPTDPATVRIQTNLDLSSTIINAKISAKQQLAIDPDTKGVLRHICLEFSRWFLDKNQQRESVKFRYEEAMKLLQTVAQDLRDGNLGDGDLGEGDSLSAVADYGEGPGYFLAAIEGGAL